MSSRARPAFIAIMFGALAGAVAALTFQLMRLVEDLVWSVSDAGWYIPIAIGIGGILIAALRSHAAGSDLEQQIREAADPAHLRRRKVALLGASAIIAVGFGGAIGPEAGLLAVVAELSALVSLRIARTHQEHAMVGQAGTAGRSEAPCDGDQPQQWLAWR
ncbi:hypothetical protein EK0264_00285 [Epidermidibacterium keratini]|uniref:Chloride channel protein n=1 Tax=Epidermidibacterium keratini TaxID=1891644 RepID=A0A7M3T530_9ACTN|nr:hypothetical protein [Epidermidibacterium keratini]QHB98890.1 hypothetical protein EK0264_00285 [Epidermidibacterium keratini]